MLSPAHTEHKLYQNILWNYVCRFNLVLCWVVKRDVMSVVLNRKEV